MHLIAILEGNGHIPLGINRYVVGHRAEYALVKFCEQAIHLANLFKKSADFGLPQDFAFFLSFNNGQPLFQAFISSGELGVPLLIVRLILRMAGIIPHDGFNRGVKLAAALPEM